MERRKLLMSAGALALAGAASRRAAAAEEVVIGAIYPMSGNAAPIGNDAKAALEATAELINGTHPPIPMLMGNGGGLPALGGAKIRVVMADHQNDPQKARAEAERLITQEKVPVLIGSYTSATAATISQVAERYEVPYISMDNSSPSLHRRGLKWYFRTSPHDEMFTEAMFDFFRDIGKKTGRPVKSVALIYEDSIFGVDSSNVQRKLAQEAGIRVAAEVKYRANSPSLSTEAQRLKAAGADVVMPTSYTNDAILMLRAMNEIGYHPRAIMAQAAGFQEPDFIKASGALAEGVFSRSSYAGDAVKARPAIPAVNAAYRARSGKDLNDNTARQVTSLQVLADAINRAGAANPAAIRKALTETAVPGVQLIVPWKGVRFDESGQNVEATPVIQQITSGVYRTVYPFDIASVEAQWNVGG
ncbi:ABC transporter substrate-binding protein [Rhodovastum atsumiense]|uniref:ABC transporter substrate-binding protein n=1 Tax=Rhodovastum atsumiense TaxID=504468 RepID=A0A5M6IV79_9PROT|nr:ABC transporter substrate-binding protein [Rhodovastum atsumiense]KAA5611305.1 ABC transporter substrate-binding protein [Rhodovastum atsumiense]CAH2601776.1 ABC transporter substrate-binding protein [Rhodovastum atsumiense]